MLNNRDLLDFVGSRFIGVSAGVVLAIILGQYVLVSFPPLFVLGFLWLMITVVRLMIIEIMSMASSNFNIDLNRRILYA